MIHNHEELKIAEQQYNNLQDAYGKMEIFHDKHPLDQLSALSMNALKAQADDLLMKINEYKNLISSPLSVKTIASLQELRSFIIKDRISQHISQDAMAKHLAITPSTYKKLEATNFDGAPFSLLKKAASFLDLPYAANIFDGTLDPSKIDIDKLSTSEMSRRGWFDGLIPAGSSDPKKDILQTFFENSGSEAVSKVLNRQVFRQNSQINDVALAAWYARVHQLASYDRNLPDFDSDKLTEGFFKQLRELSSNEDGPIKAIFELRSVGIVTVIEPHLNGTHLDGAAFFINDTRPVVALTLRYDRLDNFWFVLFHELAHIKLHLPGNNNVIFDDLDTAPDGDVIESQADKFASDNLIPESKWDNALFLMKPTTTGIERFARQLNIHPAIVAGRIRRENKNYSIFSELVGSGMVRKLFMLGNE